VTNSKADYAASTVEQLRDGALHGDAGALDTLLERIRKAEFAASLADGIFTSPSTHYPTERKELHEELDRVYDRFWRWELDDRIATLEQHTRTGAEQAQHITEARTIYEMALALAVKLTRGVRLAICPTFTPGDAIDMRRALADLLHLAHPVLPWRPKSIGSGWPGPDTLWTDDLVRWLGMLNEGATPEIFKPNTQKTPGLRATDWTRKRYRALMALWTIHLWDGRNRNAALDVAIAFGHTDARYHEKISRKAKEMIAAKQAGKAMLGLTSFDVDMGVNLALGGWTMPNTAEREHLARGLHYTVFGTRGDGPATMEEAGRRYQEFEQNCAAKSTTKRKP